LPNVKNRPFPIKVFYFDSACRCLSQNGASSAELSEQKSRLFQDDCFNSLSKAGSLGHFVGSESTHKDEYHKDDQDGADRADTAMAKAIAIAAEAPAEAADQKDDKNYD